jgi:hypothetical protein
MISKRPFFALIAAASLTACGGGGGNSAPAITTTSAPAIENSGSVSASYVKAANARYLFQGIAFQSSGILSAVVQDGNGVLTTVGGNTLTGSPTATKEIGGDASFAQGRWFVGKVTTSTNVSSQLDGTTNESFHYVAVNDLAAIPAIGSKTCDTGKFTAPSYTGGTSTTSVGFFGTTTGNATVTFDGAGAHPSMTLNTSVNGSSGSVTISGTIVTTIGEAISGAYFANGSGGLITIADGGAGTVLVVSQYRIALANGSVYMGVATFRCS